jgi:hypothetical protein
MTAAIGLKRDDSILSSGVSLSLAPVFVEVGEPAALTDAATEAIGETIIRKESKHAVKTLRLLCEDGGSNLFITLSFVF